MTKGSTHLIVVLLRQALTAVPTVQTLTSNHPDRAGCLDNNQSSSRFSNRFGLVQISFVVGFTVVGFTTVGVAAPALAFRLEDKLGEMAIADAQQPQIRSTQVFALPVPILLSQADDYLQNGDRGDAVAALQTRLAALNYYQGQIDGVFGSQTEAAVRQFQQTQGLRADGIFGPATAAALRNPNHATRPGNSNGAVGSTTSGNGLAASIRGGRFSILELQRRLQARGFYQGQIDGDTGPETRAAIAAAQRAYGLTETDILDGRFP